LQEGKFQIISEVTPHQLESAQRLSPAFVKHFQILPIEEMEQGKVLKVLEHLRNYASTNLKIQLEREAVELSYKLLKRFIKSAPALH